MEHLLPLRRAVLAALKADAGVLALVASPSIYPDQPRGEPTWPFVRYGVGVTLPREAACLSGSDISFDVHGFTKDRTNSAGQIIESAEDHGMRVGAAIKRALHRRKLSLPEIGAVTIRSTSGRVQVDGATPGAYHAIVSFRAKVTA